MIYIPKSKVSGGVHNSQEARDTLQPWKRKGGVTGVNEGFIKVYGAKAHPDKEVQDFYKKKGF